MQLRNVDKLPLASLNINGKWKKSGDGKIKVIFYTGMAWDDNDYIAIYPVCTKIGII